jgi:neutral ceramidase
MSSTPKSPRILLAGASRVVITPPIGIRMWGYTVQEGCAEGVERDLTATALVLSDGEQSVVLIAVDLLFVPMPISDRIRDRIGHQLGIAPECVLINGSHTHLGPMFPGWQEEEEPQQTLQQHYAASVEDLLVGAAGMAWNNRRPARIGTGRGSAPLGVNRREKLPDGSVIIGQNPDGPIDRTIDVIRVDDLEGRPIAVVMSAACHTVTLGPKTLLLSPDFIGPARDVIEPAAGAPSLFLQGAAGNINPACGIGSGGPEQFDDLRRLGSLLAGEVLKIWGQICTHRRKGPRRIVRSVAAISVWDYEPTPTETVHQFAITRRRLKLPLAPLPDRSVVDAEVTRYRHALREVEATGSPAGPRHVVRRMLAWAEQRQRLVMAGERQVTKEIELWACRLNTLGIAAISAEPLAELGLEIKRRSPLPHTVVLGYSNGCIGYIPPPEAFAEGGMEVVESHYNYLLPAQLTPDWAPQVVHQCVEMLAGL